MCQEDVPAQSVQMGRDIDQPETAAKSAPLATMPVKRLSRIAQHLLPAAADVETMAPSQVRPQPLRFADDIGCRLR